MRRTDVVTGVVIAVLAVEIAVHVCALVRVRRGVEPRGRPAVVEVAVDPAPDRAPDELAGVRAEGFQATRMRVQELPLDVPVDRVPVPETGADVRWLE